MQRHGLWCFALLALLYFWIGNSGVAAKCAGKWAIHACAAGNGKRSDPDMDQKDTGSNRNQLRLQDILFNKELWQNQVRYKKEPEWENMASNSRPEFEDISPDEGFPQEERKIFMPDREVLLEKLLRILKEVEKEKHER